MTTPLKIRVMHYTGTASDSDAARRLDARKLLDSGADIITMTRQHNMKAVIQDEIRKDAGTKATYRYHNSGGLGVLIRNRPDTRVVRTGKVKYHGVNVDISAYWVVMVYRGHKFTVFVSRWTPDGPGKGHGGSATKLASLIKTKGKNHPVLFAGDVSISVADKFPHDYFRKEGLATIWQDEGGYPNTAKYGKIPDVIGRYSKSALVKSAGYTIHSGYNSDKNVISALYNLHTTPEKVTSSTPTSGDKGTGSDDPFLSGGNVSWADYLDEDVFPVESVVWDTTGHH